MSRRHTGLVAGLAIGESASPGEQLLGVNSDVRTECDGGSGCFGRGSA